MMLRRFGLLCVALAMFAIAGGPWAVLQTVAWAEMLRDYGQRSGSFTVAVEQTFDGEHPCDLCRRIESAKGQQDKESNQSPTAAWAKAHKAKAVAVVPTIPAKYRERTQPGEMTAWSGRYSHRTEAPPTPPPRWADRVI